jgi:hypothetical protein
VKPWLAYFAAALVGVATPVLVLAIARETPIGSDPELAGAGVVVLLAAIAGLLAAAFPRHWWPLALVVSVPLGLLGTTMFATLANLGERYWIWLWVGLGAVAASLAAAYAAKRARSA